MTKVIDKMHMQRKKKNFLTITAIVGIHVQCKRKFI